MSSDGVPPELTVLGLREFPACTGQTGPPRVSAVLIVLTIVARSSAFECVWREFVSTDTNSITLLNRMVMN